MEILQCLGYWFLIVNLLVIDFSWFSFSFAGMEMNKRLSMLLCNFIFRSSSAEFNYVHVQLLLDSTILSINVSFIFLAKITHIHILHFIIGIVHIILKIGMQGRWNKAYYCRNHTISFTHTLSFPSWQCCAGRPQTPSPFSPRCPESPHHWAARKGCPLD